MVNRQGWLGWYNFIKRIVSMEGSYQMLLNDSGGNFLLRCNCDVEDCDIDSSF